MRRIAVLAACAVLATLAIVARLVQIQVGQGAFWADQAARIVRGGTLLPYRRGSIVDARGRVLARDRETYQLELRYRDFRREHPLGNVAHARSALEARAVPLTEALASFESWALELASLSPADLRAFGRGAGLGTATLALEPAADPDRERREQRASDVAFYAARLLQLDLSEQSALRARLREEGSRASLVELVAEWRGTTPSEVERALAARVARSRELLELLARRLDLGAAGTSPLAALVAHVEQVRSAVEELVASSLFREAAGFSPGRVDPGLLYGALDLSWMARALYWDDPRIERWTEEVRRRWTSWRDGYAVPRLLAEFIARGDRERTPERLLELMETLWREPAALEAALDRESAAGARPAVLGRFPALFGVADAAFEPPADELLASPDLPRAARWSALAPLAERIDVTDELGDPDPQRAWAVSKLLRALREPERLSRLDLELVAGVLVPEWERLFQEELARTLRRALGERELLAPNGRLALGDERTDQALETLRDLLRDRGDRALVIDAHPDYEVVYLLTRFPEELAGFSAVDARVRVRVPLPPDPRTGLGEALVADAIVGDVSAVGVDEIQRQRLMEKRLAELRARTRTPDEDAELAALVGEVLLSSESRGVSGVEGEWDDVLRGRNGYREHRGLEDVFGRGRTSAVLTPPEHGQDVALSVDAELTRAVEWMLEHPEYDGDDPWVDRGWFDEPVGAVVLLDARARVVVAASVPNEFSPDDGAARADRSLRIDRTLRKPAFQPAGSVFKPFAAAWALDRLGLDPLTEVECARSGGAAEYGGVRCWLSSGHGRVNLATALERSCNCYFAWLGEQFASGAELSRMARAFGFGRPTGLRRGGGRSGLFEEYVPELLGRRLTEHERRLAGNGLAVVEATPMQVARAFWALATGELPELTNVLAVGGEPLARPLPVPLDLSHEALETVRAGLRRVAAEPGGTAHRALSREAVGLDVVVKTGSADLSGRDDDGSPAGRGSPKHTWVAGWLPPRDPALVFVVFLDRAHTTSSHSAVYVARQLLRLPQMRAWLAERGVQAD